MVNVYALKENGIVYYYKWYENVFPSYSLSIGGVGKVILRAVKVHI